MSLNHLLTSSNLSTLDIKAVTMRAGTGIFQNLSTNNITSGTGIFNTVIAGTGIFNNLFGTGIYTSAVSSTGTYLTAVQPNGLLVSSQPVSASGSGSSVTCNAKCGTVNFTSQTVNAASTLTLTITNSMAGQSGIIAFSSSQNQSTPAYPLYLQAYNWTQGTNIQFTVANSNAAANITSTISVFFISFN
jgi:hypothetical protein